MSAYMDLNDIPATGNVFLLQDVLRKDWGFQGFVVSDTDAVGNLVTHGFARDMGRGFPRVQSGSQHGDDRICSAVGNVGDAYITFLAGLVKQGHVNPEELDNAVRPILEAKIRLGRFEHPYADEARSAQILGAPQHRSLARTAAQRSAILLRNENGALPLEQSKLSSIAIVGPIADSQTDILGGWSFRGEPKEAVTILQGIRNHVGSTVRVEYTQDRNSNAPSLPCSTRFSQPKATGMDGCPEPRRDYESYGHRQGGRCHCARFGRRCSDERRRCFGWRPSRLEASEVKMGTTAATGSGDREDPQQLALETVIVSEKLCASLAIPAGAHVLDIGCGTGHTAIAAARRRAIVTGVDLNERALARARLRAEAEGLSSIEFLKADAAAMPFPAAGFDYVLSTLGFVFLPDQEGAARELARVMRPGGVIAVTVTHAKVFPVKFTIF